MNGWMGGWTEVKSVLYSHLRADFFHHTKNDRFISPLLQKPFCEKISFFCVD